MPAVFAQPLPTEDRRKIVCQCHGVCPDAAGRSDPPSSGAREVFDGASLPQKAGEEGERREKRKTNKEKVRRRPRGIELVGLHASGARTTLRLEWKKKNYWGTQELDDVLSTDLEDVCFSVGMGRGNSAIYSEVQANVGILGRDSKEVQDQAQLAIAISPEMIARLMSALREYEVRTLGCCSRVDGVSVRFTSGCVFFFV